METSPTCQKRPWKARKRRFLPWIAPFARRLSAGSRPRNQRAGDSSLLAPRWRPPSHANSTNPASQRASPTAAAGAAALSSPPKASRPAEWAAASSSPPKDRVAKWSKHWASCSSLRTDRNGRNSSDCWRCCFGDGHDPKSRRSRSGAVKTRLRRGRRTRRDGCSAAESSSLRM